MKNYKNILIPLLTIVFVGGAFVYQNNKAVGATDVVLLKYEAGSKTATSTTGGFMTPGTGTTTYAWRSDSLTDDTLYMHLRSSTTATLLMNVEYSLGNVISDTQVDCVANPDGCDWYAENAVPVQGINDTLIVHGSTTVQHSFGFGNAASTTKFVMAINPLDGMYRRVKIVMPAGSGNATVRVQAVHKTTSY